MCVCVCVCVYVCVCVCVCLWLYVRRFFQSSQGGKFPTVQAAPRFADGGKCFRKYGYNPGDYIRLPSGQQGIVIKATAIGMKLRLDSGQWSGNDGGIWKCTSKASLDREGVSLVRAAEPTVPEPEIIPPGAHLRPNNGLHYGEFRDDDIRDEPLPDGRGARVRCCAVDTDDLLPAFGGTGKASTLCDHAYPRVIKEEHWSCCGSLVEFSTYCTPSAKDTTPKRSSHHRGEWRDQQITLEYWYARIVCFVQRSSLQCITASSELVLLVYLSLTLGCS